MIFKKWISMKKWISIFSNMRERVEPEIILKNFLYIYTIFTLNKLIFILFNHNIVDMINGFSDFSINNYNLIIKKKNL
jgi:hypothetical protein